MQFKKIKKWLLKRNSPQADTVKTPLNQQHANAEINLKLKKLKRKQKQNRR